MASGDTLCVFTPLHATPPAANYATLDQRNVHCVLDFDDTTEEAVYFETVLPRHYAGGGITCIIAWMATTAVIGDTKWGLSWERHQASTDDLDSDSFAAERTNTGTAPNAAGKVLYTSIAFSNGAQIDSLAIEEHFRLKLARKAADGADTMVGDAEMLSVSVLET